MSSPVKTLAARTMANRLTVPFARGADTLPLTLQAQGNAAQAGISPYDFAQHRALFDRLPAARYVLAALKDIDVTTQVTVDYEVRSGGGVTPGSAGLTIPAGTLAGSSFVLDLGGNEGPYTRLVRLTMSPVAPDGEAAHWWRLTALLGNLSKLLWVIGWERDHIYRQLERTKSQRRLPDALNVSLDLHGYDLGVARFPPLPYSIDDGTIALYHLNDDPGAAPSAKDIVGIYPGRVGHDGTLAGVVEVGAPGRFGNAFAFRDANAVVQVADHADFNLPANQSFTVECFLKPDATAVTGDVLSKHPNSATTQAGWALSVGNFGRGLPLNLCFKVSDGAQPPVTLFADESLTSDRFYHIAGVVDRQAQLARLYVDGALRDVQSINSLQALTNPEPVRIGHPATAMKGTVDEVRLSSVARSTFNPVLGEADDPYRRRLRLFERWALPTPDNLLSMLNQAAGPVNGDTQPFVLNDANTTLVGATHLVTVYPVTLSPGECMDDLGNRRVKEVDVSGSPDAETNFDPAFLVTHNDARVVYTPPSSRVLKTGELPPDPHKMQLVAVKRLNRLIDLIAAEGAPGRLSVERAFDPRASDLGAVGRGLLITHSGITLGRLAALAQKAAFTFTCFRADLGMVYASCAPGDYYEIQVTGGTALGDFDLNTGESVTLSASPNLPVDALVHWTTIACGTGRARFTTSPEVKTPTLQATASGALAVKVDVTRRRHTVSATRTVHIGIGILPNNGSIGVSAGSADAFFHQAWLVNHNDPRVVYGANPNNHLMQAAVARRLSRLLDLIQATGAAGTLTIVQAFVPGAPNLAAVGRALTIQHATIPPGKLAAFAAAAGFTRVTRQDPNVLIEQGSDELADITGLELVNEGASIHLKVNAKPSDIGPLVRLNWAVASGGQARARLSSTTAPEVDLRGELAGPIGVRATYIIGDKPDPYTFELRLNSTLEAANAIIRKEQYDIIMNILNSFHPIGVEVMTRAIRERVVELKLGNLLDVFPDYTYPKFRVRGPAPRRPQKE